LTEPSGVFDDRFEHGLRIEGRAADDVENLRRGSLLLQRLAQLVEQARVLDGDDGLAAKFVTSSMCFSVNGSGSCR